MAADTAAAEPLPYAPPPQAYALAGGQLFLLVAILPSVIFYFGLSGSNSLGMCVLAVLLLLMPQPDIGDAPGIPGVRPLQCQRLVVFVLALIALHLVLAGLFEPINIVRAVASYVLVLSLLFGGAALANGFIACPPGALHIGLMRAFLLLCVIAMGGTTGWGPPSLAPPWNVPVFPFSEPSAFALPFIPVLMYVSVANRGWQRLAFIGFGLFCAGLIQNLTLAVGCVLVAAVSFRVAVLAVLAVPAVYFISQLDLTYFIERVDFSGDSQNLSNLFYVQGWQMLLEGLERSNGVGVGFQQMGMHGTDVAAAQIVSELYGGEDVNVLGTVFGFAKLGTEFGVFGILLALVYLFMMVSSALKLRRVAIHRRPEPPVVTFARCVIVCYAIELFVRSPGFFTGTAMLFIASLWILWQSGRVTR